MALRQEKILEKFSLYSGEALDGTDSARDALCRALCGECARWAQRRMKPECLEDYGEEGESLAAAEAFYQLAMLDQAALPQSVSSPELKIQLGDRAEHANRLCAQKREACAPALAEEGFYFGRA